MVNGIDRVQISNAMVLESIFLVPKLNSISILLSIAANPDWKFHQLDVKNAFLNGVLEEEVYIEIPPSLKNPNNIKLVSRL